MSKKNVNWVLGLFLLASVVFVSCDQDESLVAQVDNQLKVSAVTEVPPEMQAMMDSVDALDGPKLRASFGPQPGSPYPKPESSGNSYKDYPDQWFAMEVSGSGSFVLKLGDNNGTNKAKYLYSRLSSTGATLESSGTRTFSGGIETLNKTLSNGEKYWISFRRNSAGPLMFWYGC